MNISNFNISLNNSIDLFKQFGLFKKKGLKEVGNYSNNFLKMSKSNNLIDIHNAAITNFDYEILLKDDSILQYSRCDTKLRYCFIQNPRFSPSKLDFIQTIYSKEELIELSIDEIKELENEIEELEYEQFLLEQQINLSSTMIRYDFDINGYQPLVHSCSHLHIGLNQDFRIPCSIILTPLKFSYFCIKQIYHADWKHTFAKDKLIASNLESSKRLCINLSPKQWDNIEKSDIYIA